MTSKKKTTSTPDAALAPAPTTDESATTKRYPPLDVRSTASNISSQYPMIILVAFSSKNPIPDTKNTPVNPTEAFKRIFSDITEALLFLIAHISYEPKTLLLRLEYPKQDLIIAAANHKVDVPHPK